MKRPTTRRAHRVRLAAGATATALALTLSACGTDDNDDDNGVAGPDPVEVQPDTDAGDPTNEAEPETSTPQTTLDSHAMALVAAGRTAEGEVNESRVIQIDYDDGGWDIEVATPDGTEHDIEVSADGTTVLSGPERDDTDGDDMRENQNRMEAAELDHEAAVNAIADAVPDARIEEMHLDTENGRVVWEVELAGGPDHHVDAVTGEVTRD